jgi:hypothetical protein
MDLYAPFVSQHVLFIVKWCPVITVPTLVVGIFYLPLIDNDRSDIPSIFTTF